MTKGKTNFKFNDSLASYLNLPSNSEYIDNLERIKDASLNMNKAIDEDNNIKDFRRLEYLCFTNFDEFYAEFMNKEKLHSYKPIFKSFNSHKFYSLILKSNSKTRWEILRIWTSRYTEYYAHHLKTELTFLKKLKKKLDNKVEKMPKKGITHFDLSEMQKIIQKSILDIEKVE